MSITLHEHPVVAIAHDYLTVVGGAERVVASMVHAFPGAPVYTSLYEPERVHDELASRIDVHTSALNRVGVLRRNHRLAVPFLGPAFDHLHVDADVVVCSTSGWAHGISASGRKIAYCHNTPRWVHQRREYAPINRPMWWAMAGAMHPYLKRWDRKAAESCSRYLAVSTVVAKRIRDAYGIEATVLPPPTSFDPAGPQIEVRGASPGCYLNVNRLMGHKNTDAVLEAFAEMPDLQLVIVGDGPERARLTASAPRNVLMTGQVDDSQLRWLYANCTGLVSASREDFGLTPLEAASFGKPAALLRFGGFLDTMVEGETAIFFDDPDPASISPAVRSLESEVWAEGAIQDNADRFSSSRFEAQLREIVAEELAELH